MQIRAAAAMHRTSSPFPDSNFGLQRPSSGNCLASTL